MKSSVIWMSRTVRVLLFRAPPVGVPTTRQVPKRVGVFAGAEREDDVRPIGLLDRISEHLSQAIDRDGIEMALGCDRISLEIDLSHAKLDSVRRVIRGRESCAEKNE